MIKRFVTIFILFTFLLGISPVSVFAATTKTTKKVAVTKKKVAIKKSVKRKEKLTVEPPLFTIDTAPHSPKPVARSKKKTTKKVAIKKPGTPSKVVATKKKN